MRYLLVILFCTFSAFAANDGAATYINFEAFSAGDDVALNSAMGTMSKTNGGVVGFLMHATTAQHKVRAENHPGLIRPVQVAGTLYTNSTDTKIWEVSADDNIDTNFLAWTFTASAKVSVGFEITLTNWTVGIGNFYNPFLLDGGANYSALSVIDNNPITMQAETNSNIGASVNVLQNMTYWVTMLWDSANDQTLYHFYIRTNMILAGMSKGAVIHNSTVSAMWLGVCDAHTKTTGNKYRLGNIILYTNGSVFPVMPGTFLQVPTNMTPTGVAAALTASSAGDSIVLPGTNATWTSGITLSKNNCVLTSVIDTGKGTNETKIIADGIFDCITVSGSLCVVSNFQVTGDGANDEATGIVNSGAYNHYQNLLLSELDFAFYAQNSGLIHDAHFLNNHYAGGRNIFGSSYYDTYYPQPNDTTNQMVWESNFFQWDANKNSSADAPIMSSQEGQAFTVRHNVGRFDKNLAAIAPAVDVHGDWDPGPDAFYRPAVLVQVYKNDFTNVASDISGQKFVDVRGGTVLVYSNKWTGATYDADQGIFTREEHPEDSSPYYATNCIYWENYDNGGAHAMAISDDGNCINGRNYTNVAPASLVQLPFPHPMRVATTSPQAPPATALKVRNIRLKAP
jgi:hypothetical protein